MVVQVEVLWNPCEQECVLDPSCCYCTSKLGASVFLRCSLLSGNCFEFPGVCSATFWHLVAATFNVNLNDASRKTAIPCTVVACSSVKQAVPTRYGLYAARPLVAHSLFGVFLLLLTRPFMTELRGQFHARLARDRPHLLRAWFANDPPLTNGRTDL